MEKSAIGRHGREGGRQGSRQRGRRGRMKAAMGARWCPAHEPFRAGWLRQGLSVALIRQMIPA